MKLGALLNLAVQHPDGAGQHLRVEPSRTLSNGEVGADSGVVLEVAELIEHGGP